MNITEMLSQIDELHHGVTRLQTSAAKITDTPAVTPDARDEEFLMAELKTALESVRSVQMKLSYVFRPITESSRLWKNGSGQYETTQGHCFREGSPIEILVPDRFGTGRDYWFRTYMGYDGEDYYAAGCSELPLNGIAVRVREGDET